MSFKEFWRFLEDRVLESWTQLDTNYSGDITKKEFTQANGAMNPKELEDLIKGLDKNFDGKVSFLEYVAFAFTSLDQKQ